MEDLKILSVTPSAEVTFHFFGTSNEGDKIRDALNRLVQRRRLSDFTLESTHFTFQQKPSLRLQALRVNHVNQHEVRLGDQFILSCVAQSSNGIKFVWYKDDMLVNMSKATREIWYRDLPNDGTDMHTSLLTIDKATLLDAGQYTCQVIDWGMQQCKSIYIDIKDEPDVKIVPLSATIEKGNDLQLLCITPNMRDLGIGFGWTKNRALLKLEPGNQVWEDLYPAGSILKIMNAQKSAIYTCNVAHRSMSVRVDVVNRTLIPLCPRENSWNLRWPETGPGSQVFLECPHQFIGQLVSRLCSMKDATTPAWQLPDFWDCLYQPLILPYTKFQSLTMGYQNTTGADTIISIWEILRSRKIPLYPGEGDRILNILAEIEHYQYTIHELDELYNSAETLTRIINRILVDEYSVLRQQHLLLLQQLTQRNLEYWARQLVYPYKHLALSSIVVDIRALHATGDDSNKFILQIPADDYMYPYWYNDKVTIHLIRSDNDLYDNKTLSGTVIVYKNITQFLPNTYVKELEDGTDLEYHFNSRIITVAVVPLNEIINSKMRIELKLHHLQNYSRLWNVSCGVQDLSGSWDLDSCISTLLPDEATTQCICSHPGTFAAFLTARAVRVALAKNKHSTFIVLLGCGICFLQCVVSSLILGFYFWKNRTWLNWLKFQFSTALQGAMAIFMYASYNTLSESCYATAAIMLEATLLIGMSAPISQALIIYADLTQQRSSPHFQPTVIAVITGLPILCVLATELTHKSTGWRHESWWLIFGSGVYNIFLSCVATMLSIFMLLYTGVLRKAHALVLESVVKKEVIERRIGMMHRAAIIICSLILMEAASIFYINSTSVIYHYIFASLSALLGCAVLFVYIGSREILQIAPILRKLKWNNIERESTSDPIKVYSNKKSGESGNASTPPSAQSLNVGPPYMEKRGIAAGSPDMRDYINESSVPYSKSPNAHSLVRYPPEIRIDHSDDINLENYNTSPRKYQESIATTTTTTTTFARPTNDHSSDFYSASRSTFNRDSTKFNSRDIQQSQASTQATLPECSAKVLCSADIEARMSISAMPDVTLATKTEVEHCKNTEVINRDHADVIPDIATTGERKQPDGEEKNPEITITDCENTTTTGMLDRISHDLDYLLNRTQTNEEA
ncbi:hypothetical protein PV325_007706 [Microctonus aethiopoides]|uniref:Brain-specific angiogenesis inhibitor 1 n=1 Tax=Microctonus aethiopoides TaxID=144406 RepID=A0AA39KRH6_9HYME|nr:hypothetical protein PV325_007706 [Microctonus aethiopoides]KAK0171069.1 hypothetical protein PV328_008832 [Microctonus aethiopoides]